MTLCPICNRRDYAPMYLAAPGAVHFLCAENRIKRAIETTPLIHTSDPLLQEAGIPFPFRTEQARYQPSLPVRPWPLGFRPGRIKLTKGHFDSSSYRPRQYLPETRRHVGARGYNIQFGRGV